ncbi:MAG: sugar ABC transporter substrate-binding protein [Erysipelotrichaceae bacterium]|nr:sugar ABC transporter substrate-binding protein [Erysipelotrichaceae bacterium]
MKKLATLFISMLLLLSLAACGSANSSNAPAPASSDTPASSETTPAAPATTEGGLGFVERTKNPYEDPMKFAWIPTRASEANATAWGNGLREELGYWSNTELNVFDPEGDAEQQAKIVSDLVAQGYDGIFLQTINPDSLSASVREAEEAGIPVVCINMGTTEPHAALVSMTDFEAGQVIADRIAEELNGEGNVVVIQAKVGAVRGVNLEDGFQTQLAKYPGIKILDEQPADWNMEKAQTVMNDFLTKYGDEIDAVFAHNDQMAEGAGMAVQSAGKSGEIFIWGANGETKALEYIEQGIITGTVYTNCKEQGATAARIMMLYLNSNIDTSTFTKTPVTKMPPITVDASNVSSITPDMRW